MKRLTVLFLSAILVLGMSACGQNEQKEEFLDIQNTDSEAENMTVSASTKESEANVMYIPESFVLIMKMC